MTDSPTFRCGSVAIVGPPNVGKSTLLNALIDTPLSVVTPRAHTTRHRILGIANRADGQILYLDTPGLQDRAKYALHRHLNLAVLAAVSDADVAVQVVVAEDWKAADAEVYKVLATRDIPRFLVVNKVDRVKQKAQLLPFLDGLSHERHWDDVFPLSARRKGGLAALEQAVLARLPVAPARYDEDSYTDRSERFLAGERVRGQLMRQLGEELPYATSVEVEQFVDRPDGITAIACVIWVEREGQKAIVIGTGGRRAKAIGTAARHDIEALLGRRVFLSLKVRVRAGWTDNEAALKQFGYE